MINKAFFMVSAIASIFLSSAANALESGNAFVTEEAVPINSFMLIIGTLLGLITFGSGLFGVSKSSSMPQQYPMKANVTKMAAGILLLSAGGFYEIVMNSMGMAGAGSSLNVADSDLISTGSDSLKNSVFGELLPKETIKILLSFIYLVGLYAFLKGIYMLKDLGANQAQQQGGSAKSSIVHIVGGVITMNITTFSCIVGSTLGMPELCAT